MKESLCLNNFSTRTSDNQFIYFILKKRNVFVNEKFAAAHNKDQETKKAAAHNFS